MHLISMEKAGNFKLARFHKQHMVKIRNESRKIASRVKGQQHLSLEDQLVFYSDWKYTSAHLACALPDVNSAPELAAAMNIGAPEAEKILKFLLDKGLVMKKGETLVLGVTHSHLGKDSPLIATHHRNWRTFTMERASDVESEELMYTAPMVKRTEGCPDEDLRVLTIDFLRVGRR